MGRTRIKLTDDITVVGKVRYLITKDGTARVSGYRNRWVRGSNGVPIKKSNIEIINELKELYSFLWD